MAKTPIEQLTEAQTEITRLTGLESQFNAALAQVPGGNLAGLTTLLAEHGQFKGDVQRLSGEVGVLTTRATTAEGEVARLTGELATARASVNQTAEERAAEIVATTGNQAPAKADGKGDGKGAPSTRDQHWAKHSEIMKAEGSSEADKYYRANKRVMNSY